MSVEINLPPFFQPLADDARLVIVSSGTVGKCFGELVTQYPRLKTKIFNRKGELHNGLMVFINGEAAYPGGLAGPVYDGDKLYVTYVVMGG